jgi:hypothetical protein
MSAVITVQIGQCGNQLGATFFDSLASAEERDSTPAEALPTFFREKRSGASVARAVLLDTEPRVISTIVRNTDSDGAVRVGWTYPKHNEETCIWNCSGSSGAANNWAFGFYGQGEKLLIPSMDLIRKEAENCSQVAFRLLQE